MSSRVQDLELRERRRMADESSVFQQHDNVSIKTVTGNSLHFSSSEAQLAQSSSIADFDFIEDLENSWVYKRNGVCRETAFALSITDAHSTTWSCLSSLSVAQISNVSVINLPITMNEVFDPQHFSQTWSDDPGGQVGSSHPQAYSQASQYLATPREEFFCRGCSKVRNVCTISLLPC